jgi:predicted dehydrogenase
MSGLTAALLGVEHPHSLAHLRTLQTLPEVERVLLWDESEAALAEVQHTQGDKIVGTSTNLDDLLADRDLSFVIGALRNDLAVSLYSRVIAAGKHILAEKPLGRNAWDAAQIVKAAERAGIVLSVCYQNRCHPSALEARRIVQAGLLGPLISLESRMITTAVRFRTPELWLFNQAHAGGGILTWLGCHYLDLLRFVSGDEVESVSAEMATLSGEQIDVEDVISLSLRFRSGALGTMNAGYMLVLSGYGYHNSGYDAYLAFRGANGRLYWDPTARPPSIYAESNDPAWVVAPKRDFRFEPGTSTAYGGAQGETFVRTFVRATQGDAAPPTTGRDGLQVARIVDAAYESSRTGRRVYLPED